MLFNALAVATKAINNEVRSAPINNLFGMTGIKNVQGEEVKALDIIGNDNFIDCLTKSGQVCAMVSEEEQEILTTGVGDFILCFDPLDGSSNIELAIPVGSIFAIYQKQGEKFQESDVLQPGKNMVAGGYTLYGSATEFVLATHSGVNIFTLNPVSGEYELTQKNLKIPSKGSIYSVNEGNYTSWLKQTKDYVSSKKETKKPYSLRYVGSMVADVHRTLIKGGIFMYPADIKSPDGKLRLLYECNPMSFIVEKAGGKSTTGSERILDIIPKKIHQRVPIYLGSPEDIDELLKF